MMGIGEVYLSQDGVLIYVRKYPRLYCPKRWFPRFRDSGHDEVRVTYGNKTHISIGWQLQLKDLGVNSSFGLESKEREVAAVCFISRSSCLDVNTCGWYRFTGVEIWAQLGRWQAASSRALCSNAMAESIQPGAVHGLDCVGYKEQSLVGHKFSALSYVEALVPAKQSDCLPCASHFFLETTVRSLAMAHCWRDRASIMNGANLKEEQMGDSLSICLFRCH